MWQYYRELLFTLLLLSLFIQSLDYLHQALIPIPFDKNYKFKFNT
jgi:hypothetical protein